MHAFHAIDTRNVSLFLAGVKHSPRWYRAAVELHCSCSFPVVTFSRGKRYRGKQRVFTARGTRENAKSRGRVSWNSMPVNGSCTPTVAFACFVNEIHLVSLRCKMWRQAFRTCRINCHKLPTSKTSLYPQKKKKKEKRKGRKNRDVLYYRNWLSFS